MNNNDIIPGFDNQACDYLEIGLTRGRGAAMDLLISLKGSIDAYNSDCLRQRIRMVIDAGFTRLSLVLSGVDSISSTGVATFLSLQKELEEKGGGITMVNVPGKIKGVFALLCLQTFFRCIESLDPESG